jgi:hypothetical protein
VESSAAPGRRGLSHYLKGRAPNEVARLLTAAVQALGGPGSRFQRVDVRDYFAKEQAMSEREAEAFADELVYGAYAFRDRPPATYRWRPDVYRLVRHRAWRFPRGQLDLPAALQLITLVAEAGGPLAMSPDLRVLYQRLKEATKDLK